MKKKYVIIGNSTAGIYAVEGIRSLDEEGKITVVSDEKYLAYGRPLISYYLYEKTDLDRMQYRRQAWYDEMGVTQKFGVRAQSIDAEKKEVTLSTGEKLPYDELLVATGSRPFIPPMEGVEKVENKYSFMTLDDALQMEKDFKKEDDVLIVGAGLIGLKCLEGVLHRVRSVSVVDMANRILPSILDDEASVLVQEYLEKKGVSFYLSDGAERFEKDSVTLKSGKKIGFSKLVLAVGVRPNVELVSSAGGKCDKGVVVDEGGRTTLPNVYAAGDCALSYDVAGESVHVLALLPNAAMQGEVAGKNMAGGNAVNEKNIPMNAMGLLGYHIMTAGVYEGETFVEKSDGAYKKFFVKDGVLKGYILLGDVKRAGIYTSLVRERTPLSDIDFSLIVKNASLLAFSKSERKKKLGAEV